MTRIRTSESGFALVTVTLLGSILFAFTLSYFDLLVGEQGLLRLSRTSEKVEAIAEAGIEEVLWEYNYGGADFSTADGWSGATSKTKTVSAFTNASGQAVGSYTTTISNWNTNTPKIVVTASRTFSGNVASATTKAQLQPRPIFGSAIQADGDISFDSNSSTDSYDSADGAYDPSTNMGSNGDVTTNSSSDPAITLGSNAEINGDAGTGPGGSVDPVSHVTGSVSDSVNQSLPNNDLLFAGQIALLNLLPDSGMLSSPQTITNDKRYQSISLSSNQTVYISGNVSFYVTNPGSSGSGWPIQLDSNSSIRINPGSTLTIYTAGNIDLDSNSWIGSTQGSAGSLALKIYGLSTCASVNMDSNSQIYGTLSVPDAHLELDSNTDIYGAVIANDVHLDSNAAVHYDENLAVNGPSSGWRLKWHRRVF